MKAVVIGSTGIIGGAVVSALEGSCHEVLGASRRGALRVDLEQPDSVDALFAAVGPVDAVIVTAGSGALVPLLDSTEDELFTGLHGKLLGQVRLVRGALASVRDGGSITLTSGAIPEATAGASFGALTNAGLNAFVRRAAVELPRGVRLNAVSPGWVRETLVALGPEARAELAVDVSQGTPASEVAEGYVRLATGRETGRRGSWTPTGWQLT
ncbi:short chain dehydrogenase [Streptomyces sp. NPDC048057]|uniref:short chain dehydrogenase n=1 Tax=Streptomyces sp. NPDC048057 TaxID=3155628 RepID=UPI0033C2B6B9